MLIDNIHNIYFVQLFMVLRANKYLADLYFTQVFFARHPRGEWAQDALEAMLIPPSSKVKIWNLDEYFSNLRLKTFAWSLIAIHVHFVAIIFV